MNQPEFQQINDKSGIIGAVASRIGGRSENQDSFLISETPLGLLVTVCDGMGGGPAGKTASSMAAEAIEATAARADAGMDPADVLRVAVKNANQAVIDATLENPALRGMGTTCVAVLVNSGKGYIVHVGDSRCYQIRDGKMQFRTADHSYVAELVRRGTLSEEEARNSNFSNVITRAIGADPKLDPEVDIVRVMPNDRFALMTDGIWGALPEESLVAALGEQDNPVDIVSEIAMSVDRIGDNKGGGHDNLTLAMIELPGVETVGEHDRMAAGMAVSGWDADSAVEIACDDGYSIEDETPDSAGAPPAPPIAPPAVGTGRKLAEKVAEQRRKGKGKTPPSDGEGAPVKQTSGKPQAGKDTPDGEEREAGKAPASSGSDNKKDAEKKKIKRWRLLFCVAATAVVGLGVWVACLQFGKDDNDKGVAVTEAEGFELSRFFGIGADGDSEEDNGKGDKEKEDKNKGNKPEGNSGSGAGKSDEKGIDPAKALMGIVDKSEENREKTREVKHPDSSLEYLKGALRMMEELKVRYPEDLSKKNNEEGWGKRLKHREDKLKMIREYLNNAYDKEDDRTIKKSIDDIRKRVKGKEDPAKIDKNAGQPTDDCLKAVRVYGNQMRELIQSMEKAKKQ